MTNKCYKIYYRFKWEKSWRPLGTPLSSKKDAEREMRYVKKIKSKDSFVKIKQVKCR